MKIKEDLILESLYSQVVSEAKAKHKSKKQVGYLLSDKVSPLSKKQKEKLKGELHKGKVKVDEEVEIVFDSYLNEWVLSDGTTNESFYYEKYCKKCDKNCTGDHKTCPKCKGKLILPKDKDKECSECKAGGHKCDECKDKEEKED